jgi:coenzyme F420-0:L-glutamate ligase/coenzyme F420-1:gamma-L-glutamate ligase
MADPATLVLTALPGIPRIAAGDDLQSVIEAGLQRARIELADGDILVLAQKIVSKAEGRSVLLNEVTPSPRAQDLARETGKDARVVELILSESKEVLRVRPGLIVVEHRLGFVLANAGIDASNVDNSENDERVLLLPADPDASCARLRTELERRFGKKLGVVINDSLGRAWRMGTVGTALGSSGLVAMLDLRGRKDMNGRILRSSEIGAADEVAAAASLLMGQAAEGRPIIHMRGFPYALGEGSARDLQRPPEMDLFR